MGCRRRGVACVQTWSCLRPALPGPVLLCPGMLNFGCCWFEGQWIPWLVPLRAPSGIVSFFFGGRCSSTLLMFDPLCRLRPERKPDDSALPPQASLSHDGRLPRHSPTPLSIPKTISECMVTPASSSERRRLEQNHPKTFDNAQAGEPVPSKQRLDTCPMTPTCLSRREAGRNA
jgi:hypothetical protein